MVERVATLLLALLLGIAPAAAAPATLSEAVQDAAHADTDKRVRQALQGVLEQGTLRFPSKEQGRRVGDWYLHPYGFAFRIPGGMVLQKRSRDAVATLVDESNTATSVSTTILVSITNEDNRLKTMTEKDVISAYSSRYDQFKLVGLKRETRFGVECVHLTFLMRRAPQLLYEQYLFSLGGRSYVVTLMAENSIRTLPSAWRQLDVFWDCFMFI